MGNIANFSSLTNCNPKESLLVLLILQQGARIRHLPHRQLVNDACPSPSLAKVLYGPFQSYMGITASLSNMLTRFSDGQDAQARPVNHVLANIGISWFPVSSTYLVLYIFVPDMRAWWSRWRARDDPSFFPLTLPFHIVPHCSFQVLSKDTSPLFHLVLLYAGESGDFYMRRAKSKQPDNDCREPTLSNQSQLDRSYRRNS